jgi:ribosomal protein S18 acetylase RimI-like enzyme
MTQITPEQMAAIAATMADSFLEDPLMQEIFKGIEGAREIIYQHSLIQMNHFIKDHDVFLVEENPQAFLIGIDSANEKKFAETLIMLKIMLKTLGMLKPGAIITILANNQRTSRVLSLSWQKEFLKERYYHIKIIAIAEEMRGSGAFRKLVTPVIERCEIERIPIILETHNPRNVPIYEHYGFQVVSTRSAGGLELKQYCMLRSPQPVTK